MRVAKRRRRESKTDYKKRIKLLKSNNPRIIFRKTNRYLITQYVFSQEAQDKVMFQINSKKLLNFGWPKQAKGSLKSISAAYFLGLLMGKKIKEKKLSTPITDFGMIKMLYKTKTYAFLKGLAESGIEIKCKDEFFPEENRIKGEHMKNKIPFDEIKIKILKE